MIVNFIFFPPSFRFPRLFESRRRLSLLFVLQSTYHMTARSSSLHSIFLLSLFLIASVQGNVRSTSSSKINSMVREEKDKVRLVFSDLDGTLIHYPKKTPSIKHAADLLMIPTSSTGMRGIISQRTLVLTQEIRQKKTKFILVSGMRSTTLFNRLPFLPRADAYCAEGGGRIFYPVDTDDTEDGFIIKPMKYEGAKEAGVRPFRLVEDLEWRKMMENYAGKFVIDIPGSEQAVEPINVRDGELWKYARFLIEKGYVIDTKGYSSCFRVNKKQQNFLTEEDFLALLDGRVPIFDDLAKSVNLSCIDVYPSISGKKNCCQYLAEKFFPDLCKDIVLASIAVCLCDDDNDISMALACQHAYCPQVTSDSMLEVIDKNPGHFTVFQDSEGTKASERALTLLLERLEEEEGTKE